MIKTIDAKPALGSVDPASSTSFRRLRLGILNQNGKLNLDTDRILRDEVRRPLSAGPPKAG
jgi:hypothetical protein